MTADRRPKFTIYSLLRPYTASLAIGLCAVFVEGAANLAEPWPIKIVLDAVIKPRSGSRWLRHLPFFSGGVEKITMLKAAALGVLLIAAVGAVCSYTERCLTTKVGQHVMHELRQRVYSQLHRFSLAFYDDNRTGDLISRLTGDVDAIQNLISSGLLGALVNGLTLVGMIGVVALMNWRFTLIALSVAPPLFLVVFSFTRRIKKASKEVRQKESAITSIIQEALSSIRVIKAFAREDFEQNRLAKESLAAVNSALQVRSLKALLSPLVDMIVAIGTCMVVWFGGRMALRGTLSAGSLVLFIWYLGKMYKPMKELSKMTDVYSKAAVAYDRIREVLEGVHEVQDIPGARPAPSLRGLIRLDNVTFGYERDCSILKQVSMTIEPGQIAALVGPAGSGKTTITALIARFYDPDSGAVKIDGIDVKTVQQKSLRQQISFVLQDTVLFHGPVWYNIAYGRPEASRDEILRAAELANVDEFIGRLPQGYDTVIGERGMTLSGGQRQRIAIARAVIRNTPIVVLDEPGTGLDAVSEDIVLEALGRLMVGKTSITIAHKLATVRYADVIFVLSNGQIVECGDHRQLLRMGGIYAEYYHLQSCSSH